VRIADANGADVPEGEVGTLWVGGGSAAAFYWNRHERSRETLRGSWVVTSDLFRRDADGYYWYQGRSDDVLKVAGRWVTPNEIEAALCQHEAVAEAGAAAYEEAGLTKPMAFVILRGGAERSEGPGQGPLHPRGRDPGPLQGPPASWSSSRPSPGATGTSWTERPSPPRPGESAARRGLKG
jgi:acyl-coenzyme A synthetase/AMP-(fatty) acid ligase